MTDVRLECGCETTRVDPHLSDAMVCPRHDYREVDFEVIE